MSEAALLGRIHRAIPASAIFDAASAGGIPAGPGAYILLIHLPDPVRFARRAIPSAVLSGWLLYVGSAYGGGGLAARLKRHLMPGKPVHWHVDELTNVADRIAALAVPDGAECDLVAALERSGHFVPALRGFGSSDCRRCTAHLLRPVSA